MSFILSNYAVKGIFADGYECIRGGRNEAECMKELGNMQDKHGELIWYSNITDEEFIEEMLKKNM